MRNFQDIADKIIKVIEEECDFDEERVANIIAAIEGCKKSNNYRSPELQWMSWEELAEILNKYFEPSNSKWETKLMIIFNNLEEGKNGFI